MIDAKELKKIAAACRKAGITHYKCNEFEFTLTNESPKPPRNHKSLIKTDTSTDTSAQPIAEDQELTQEQLLMWSVTGEGIQ